MSYSHALFQFRSQYRKCLTSLFIIAYLYFFNGPNLFPSTHWKKIFFQPAICLHHYLHMGSKFNLFAPNPSRFNLCIFAKILFSDGTWKIWHYPQCEKYPLIERMFHERFRKYGYQRLFDNNNSRSARWEDLALYVAGLYKEPKQYPILVKFIVHKELIPIPGQESKDHTNYKQDKVVFAYYFKSRCLQ